MKLTACSWVSILLAACAHEPERIHAPAQAVQEVSLGEARAAVEQTLVGMREDLRSLEAEWVQLSGIDEVRSDERGFTWSKGLRGSIKVRQPDFAPDGCYVSVEILAYDPATDVEVVELLNLSSRAFQHHELPGGLRLATWTVVRAEPDEEGRAFEIQVFEHLSERLRALHERLHSRPIAERSRG